MMSFRPCAIVPSHNHWSVAGAVVARLRAACLPVFVVDDGSAEPARSVIAALHDPDRGVTVLRLDVNRGKGAAVMVGFGLAAGVGFTHAIQVDADGQHDLEALPQLMATAARHPEALVSGQPVYDDSIPKGRMIGRWITHVWVWVETLSLAISDSMCGFRVYPLAAVMALLAEERVGQRMDFDTEIMVRLFWRGTPVAMVPVRVTYPLGNTSNFDILRDNWRITCMHTRLVLTMALRLPRILRHRPPPLAPARHWSALTERGLYQGLRYCAGAYRLLGRRGCLMVMAPVVLYFFLTGAEQRRASTVFRQRVANFSETERQLGLFDGYRHFLNFAACALDTFIAWVGGMPSKSLIRADNKVLDIAAADRRGALFIVCHLGNAELCRALLDPETRGRLTLLVHTRHAEHYNRVLREFRPEAAFNTFQVTEIGPETAIALKERVERGEWVVIAGDRTPVGFGRQRVSRVPFLGAEAGLSQGPYILAALLECPVYLLFCLREDGTYRLYAEKFADRIELPRHDRTGVLNSLAGAYAARLEHYCLKAPLQWFNFFDFWTEPC
ncbi:MAG: glycosyltransferase [Rhodospirillaceae bacterium]